MIYDRTVYDLMKEAAASLTPPFTVSAIVAWFGEHYPKIKYNTIIGAHPRHDLQRSEPASLQHRRQAGSVLP